MFCKPCYQTVLNKKFDVNCMQWKNIYRCNFQIFNKHNRKVISLNTFISYMAYRIYKHKLYCKFLKLNKLQYTQSCQFFKRILFICFEKTSFFKMTIQNPLLRKNCNNINILGKIALILFYKYKIQYFVGGFSNRQQLLYVYHLLNAFI